MDIQYKVVHQDTLKSDNLDLIYDSRKYNGKYDAAYYYAIIKIESDDEQFNGKYFYDIRDREIDYNDFDDLDAFDAITTGASVCHNSIGKAIRIYDTEKDALIACIAVLRLFINNDITEVMNGLIALRDDVNKKLSSKLIGEEDEDRAKLYPTELIHYLIRNA